MTIEEFVIDEAHAAFRLDKALSELCPDLSRSRIKTLIEAGMVSVDDFDITLPKHKVEAGSVIRIAIPPAIDDYPVAQAIPLDIIFEDQDLLVINKAADMVVHPGAGNPDSTLVNALLHHCPDELSGIGGVKRPGIVHRLDKETSGLLVVAKNDRAHQGLSAQLSDRSLSRIYKTVVWRVPNLLKGRVDIPIARHKTNRLKMAVRASGDKQAVTHYHVEETYGAALALVTCQLETGRTHQIRVHMQHIKHPLVGDPLYGLPRQEGASLLNRSGYTPEVRDEILKFPRQALHAAQIGFIHPRTGEEMRFSAPLPHDMIALISKVNTIG